MNSEQALKKLLELKEAYIGLHWDTSLNDDKKRELRTQVPILYGEIEDIYIRLAGIRNVEVEGRQGQKATYQTYLQAAIESPWTYWISEGKTELLKVIGKIQQLSRDPEPLHIEHSITNLVQILQRFRECCQYIDDPPKDENAVQDIMWIMLRAQFDRLDREDTLRKFGSKSYRPDFGIPDLQVLIEAKFIGIKTKVQDIQDEILTDVPAYLNESTKYKSLIFVVYDAAHQLRDARKFTEDLKSIDGIVEVIVIPGIGFNST